jgi:N-methylhydantoinase B
VREIEFLAPAEVAVVSDRRRFRPYGKPPGKAGRNFLNGRPLPGKVRFAAKAGDRVRIETPGGGGLS